jgi:HD superfamily phosphohydrolase
MRDMEIQVESLRRQSMGRGGGVLLRVSAEEIKETYNQIISSGLTGDRMDWAIRQLSRLQEELDRNIDEYWQKVRSI